MMYQDLIDESYVVNLRREFHRHPELSMQETCTSRRVYEELSNIGMEVERVEPLTVIGILRTGKPGKTIALRADMDALPMQESSQNAYGEEKKVVSEVKGVAHTCGHDAHTAMLLGAAKALWNMKSDLCGTILFCFEQGEENGGGISYLLAALEKYHIDACWALHTRPTIPSGKMAICEGPSSAGLLGFEVEIIGKGCHGAEVMEGIDPIMCGVHIIDALNDIITRRTDPKSPAVLSIGKFCGGTAPNIIPNKAVFAGTMRFFSLENGSVMKNAFYDIVDGVCKAFRCKYQIKELASCAPLINDSQITALASSGISEVIGKENIETMIPLMGSETFANMAVKYPAAYGYLGIDVPDKGPSAMPHMPDFDIDESSLRIGAAATVAVARKLLNV